MGTRARDLASTSGWPGSGAVLIASSWPSLQGSRLPGFQASGVGHDWAVGLLAEFPSSGGLEFGGSPLLGFWCFESCGSWCSGAWVSGGVGISVGGVGCASPLHAQQGTQPRHLRGMAHACSRLRLDRAMTVPLWRTCGGDAHTAHAPQMVYLSWLSSWPWSTGAVGMLGLWSTLPSGPQTPAWATPLTRLASSCSPLMAMGM